MQRPDYSSNVHINSCIRFALLNARFVNNKAATINDLITYNEIDTMIITETWHTLSTDIQLRRSAPPGYIILDAPRPNRDDSINSAHGGVAIIHSSNFKSRYIAAPFQPTTFELLISCLKKKFFTVSFTSLYTVFPASL